jgi:uncharacterized membrane protein
MEAIWLLRWLHILGGAVLLGTGAGIAFFMLMAHRSGEPRIVAHTASTVIAADWIFTATAVVAQPVTGVLLALAIGWPLTSPWLLLSVGLYVAVGALWLPVVWIQYRLRALAREAVAARRPLDAGYRRLFRIWVACGIPAFTLVLLILALMVIRRIPV